MFIALDFDGTYTEDPKLWSNFISQAITSGHRIAFVTMRHDNERESIESAIKHMPYMKVFYTGRKAKKPFMASLNQNPDIWIDDNPHWINQDSM